MSSSTGSPASTHASMVAWASARGLTLLHVLAQRRHLLWNTLGGFSVSVTKTSQLGLKSGRVDECKTLPFATAWSADSAD